MNRQERAEQAAKMYTEDGLIIREIAERLGHSKATIWKDLVAQGVEMRPTPADYRRQRMAQDFIRRAAKKEAKEKRKAEWYEDHSEPSLDAVLRLIDSL